MPKPLKASKTTPFELLLGGKGVVSREAQGQKRGLVPFPEILEEGWTVEAPSKELGAAFGGIDIERKLLIAPLDESKSSMLTKAHEMGHVLLTPKIPLAEMEATSGIPANVINAFEDGRVNGVLRQSSPVFAEQLKGKRLPVDAAMLARSVVDAREQRELQLERGNPQMSARYLEDPEIRMVGACLMAASEMYSERREESWREIGRACLLDEQQVEAVANFSHKLKELSYDQMIEGLRELADYLLDEPTQQVAPPPVPIEVEMQGTGGYGSPEQDMDGVDSKPEDSGSTQTITPSEGETIKVAVAKPRPSLIKERLQRAGSRVASFDPAQSAAKNKRSFSQMTATSASSPLTITGRTIESSVEYTGKKVEAAKTREEQPKEKLYDGDLAILNEHYGVTVAEERGMLRNHGYEEVTDDPRYRKSSMTIKEFPLDEKIVDPSGTPRKARKHDRVGYMTSPWRHSIDGKIYRRKMRVRRNEPAGSLLLDLSGSMSPSSELIRRCLNIAPYATIGGYAGRGSGRGCFAILAHNGRAVSQQTLHNIIVEFGGGNEVDLPALEWLATQKPPRIWVSDAGICGTPACGDSYYAEALNIQRCFQTARAHKIIRVLSLEMLVGLAPLSNNLDRLL